MGDERHKWLWLSTAPRPERRQGLFIGLESKKYITCNIDRAFRRESTREESAGIFIAMKTKVCTIVGSGEKCLLSDPGSELRLGREKDK